MLLHTIISNLIIYHCLQYVVCLLLAALVLLKSLPKQIINKSRSKGSQQHKAGGENLQQQLGAQLWLRLGYR